MTKKEIEDIALEILIGVEVDYEPDRVDLLSIISRIIKRYSKIKETILEYDGGEKKLDWFGIDP